MKINGLTFENPDYGYETKISMPFHIARAFNGELSIRDDGKLYDKWLCDGCKVIMDRSEIESFYSIYNSVNRGERLDLTDTITSGFFPFTPLLPEGTGHTVYLDSVRNRGAVNVLAKTFSVEFSLLLEYNTLTYNTIVPDNCKDGSIVIGSSGLEVDGIRYPEGGFKPYKSYMVNPINTNGGKIYGSYYDSTSEYCETGMKIICTEKNCRNILYRLLYSFRSSVFKIYVPERSFPFGYDKGDDQIFNVRLTSGDISVKHIAFNQFEIDLNLILVD